MKKILCLTFTCPRDFARAAFHQKFLPEAWTKIWCVESAHLEPARTKAPAGTELLAADFPRGKTLRHADAIAGMRRVFLDLAARPECGLLVKLDSDTALFRPEAWTAPFAAADVDFTYVRRHVGESRLLANGCAYAASRRALKRLENFDPEKHAPAVFKGHEDLIFSAFFTGGTEPRNRDLTLCWIDKRKFWWRARPYRGADCFGGHFGYVSQAQDFAECEAQIRARESAQLKS